MKNKGFVRVLETGKVEKIFFRHAEGVAYVTPRGIRILFAGEYEECEGEKMIRREIEGGMPFDKVFFNEDGQQINCHATGMEVLFEGEDNIPANWWNEYEDWSTGELYYGR